MTVGSAPLERFDQVALEEPLEVLLKHGPSDSRPWLTLLRTPNLDFELVAGLLYSEGLVSNSSDIASMKFCTRAEPWIPKGHENPYGAPNSGHSQPVSQDLLRPDKLAHSRPKDKATGHPEGTRLPGETRIRNGDLPTAQCSSDSCDQDNEKSGWEPNSLRRLTVTLKKPLPTSLEGLSRNILTHGGCGMCSAHQVAKAELAPLPRCAAPESDQIFSMLEQLAQHQPIFKRTGGTHAAGWFSSQAPVVFEDVGRHNCVDKLVGHFLLANQLPKLSTGVLVLSGRLGFELVFKAYRARIPWIISLGAPTSMSVEFAKQQGIGLIAFANPKRYNIY